MVAIRFENISKQYRLGTIGTGTLSHDLNRWWQMNVQGREDPFLKVGQSNTLSSKEKEGIVWALRDINLSVEQGEVLGIIGKNGAGKSTLLKLLSRVTAPTTGRIRAWGRVASLLEVGTGFHPEMTGRENIYMNGSIMGMTKAEINRKFDEIVDFAGVERYIDTPVKRYSSGMTVRLGFAIAAHLEPEILVVDEVLAVGDAEFQKKAIGKMQDISKGEGRTVLFVSHNMGAVSRLCTVGAVMKNGSISFHGNVDEAVLNYLENNESGGNYVYGGEEKSNKDVFFEKIIISDNDGKERDEFFYYEQVNILFNLKINKFKSQYNLFCMILDKKLNRVFSAESEGIKEQMQLRIDKNFLVRGNYSIHAFVHIPKVKQEDVAENVCSFKIIDTGSALFKHGNYDYGQVFGKFVWK